MKFSRYGPFPVWASPGGHSLWSRKCVGQTVTINSILTQDSSKLILNICFSLFQVTMADRAAAERACKEPNPVIDGRKANVNLAYLGAKPRGIQTGEYRLLDTGWEIQAARYRLADI